MSPDAAVVHLDDDTLLRGLADLRWRVDDLLAGGRRFLVVDIAGLARLSSATLAALLWAHRACRARGGRLVLSGPNRRCQEMLSRTGLVDVFAVTTTAPAGPTPAVGGRVVAAGSTS
jgi:anti-anti-sigma factor